MKMQTLKDPRRRKMLLILPLLVIPFVTMAFWALGGGKTDASTKGKEATGLNLDLPNAQLKDDKGENKLSYYEEAEKDSLKWREGMENDPLFRSTFHDSLTAPRFGYDPSPLSSTDYKDPNEEKVYQKLAELNSHLQTAGNHQGDRTQSTAPLSLTNAPSSNKEDVDRLQEMMNHVSAPSAKDPEVDQLNSMMDRVLDIQHPERVKQRLNENSSTKKEQVFDAHRISGTFTISLLDTENEGQVQLDRFYGMDNETVDNQSNAIEAVIHGTQTLVDGSIVKMRLVNDIVIQGAVIVKGSFVFGKASLEGERLQIEINSIRQGNALYAVKLKVFDLDGMEGVHIPGAITRDVAKQSVDNSLQNIEMTSIDPSLKMQAASAGINAAKSLLTKKAKLVKVTLKAGYKILLKSIS